MFFLDKAVRTERHLCEPSSGISVPHAPFREASKSYRDSPFAPPRSHTTPGWVGAEVGVCDRDNGSHIDIRDGVAGVTLVAEPSPLFLPKSIRTCAAAGGVVPPLLLGCRELVGVCWCGCCIRVVVVRAGGCLCGCCIRGVFAWGLALAVEQTRLVSVAASSRVRLASAATLPRCDVTVSSLPLRWAVGFLLVGCPGIGSRACCCSRLASGWFGVGIWCDAVVGVGVRWTCTTARLAALAPRVMLPWVAFTAVRNSSSKTRRCIASSVSVLKSLAKSRVHLNCVGSFGGRGATPFGARAT